MKILIPNASNAANVGDQAILLALLEILRRTWPRAHVTIHASKPESYKHLVTVPIGETVYSWAVFERRNLFVRAFRCAQLAVAYACCLLGIRNLPVQRALKQLLADYRSADLIIFTGGGSLRTKKGLTQTLNLLMQLLMLEFARLVSKEVIVAPISFGPFAHQWQEWLSARVLRAAAKTVMIRENISFNRLTKYRSNNAILSSDLAFLLPQTVKEKSISTNPVIGFTIRQWFEQSRQLEFEADIQTALKELSVAYGAKIVPIVQVHSPEFGDVDLAISQKLVLALRKTGVTVEDVVVLNTVEEAFSKYASIDVLIGMRMHSNILAALVRTPFVPISYEHKTEGIADQLGVLPLCLSPERNSSKEIVAAVHEIISHYSDYQGLIRDRISLVKDLLARQLETLLRKEIP